MQNDNVNRRIAGGGLKFSQPGKRRDDKQQKALINQISDRYMSAPALTLIGTVEGAAFRLDRNKCPVGSDPAVQALHGGLYEKLGHAGKYCNRPIHVSL